MGVDRPLMLLLDLGEPVSELCRYLQDLALSWLQSGNIARGFDYGRLLNFDPKPVMDLIVKDFARHPHEFSTVDEVAVYLKQQGVPPDFATWLSCEISQMTLDVIAHQLPNFSFRALATECMFDVSSNGRVLSITFLSGMEFDRKNVPRT